MILGGGGLEERGLASARVANLLDHPRFTADVPAAAK